MADRKAELERKKQKLAAIREEKERRRREKESKEEFIKENEVEVTNSKFALTDCNLVKDKLKAGPMYMGVNEDASSKSNKAPKDIRTEADELLSSLGIPGVDSSPRSSSTATPEPSLSPAPDLTAPTPASPASSNRVPKKKTKLSVANVQQTNIPPKENVTYNKQTQTTTPSIDREAQPLDYYVIHWDEEWEDEFPVLTYDDMPGEDESSASHDSSAFNKVASGLPHVELVKPAVTADDETKKCGEPQTRKIRDLSEEEKQEILLSEDFHKFFDKTSRIIERALEEDLDFLVDYTGASGEDGEGDDKSGMKVSLNRCFFDDRWSKNRTVTCMDWSTQFPELLVASYNNNEESPHDPDGVALIWNMKFKKTTPEYIFHCQSAVMSATFAKFHPNLIIGGTYSGQIVLWDNRSSKRTPVQRSPLTAAAHTHPVYCVKVVGTQNAHNLISVSTDGKFCSWSLDMLSAPQDTMELQHKQSKAVAVTSLSFPPGDVNNFAVGSEEGSVYTACRHGSKAGILEAFDGHQGPVTGIDIHNSQGQIDFSHLFLTSSFDWTIKLWSFKENKFLYSFEDNGDYVYDVSWSPIHPTLFAAVDGMGRLDLWNLNNDTEVPTASVVIDGAPALNRVTWTPSGHHVAAGDDFGKIWLHDVGEQLALPRNDEWSKFVNTLQEIKNNQADVELDGSLSSSFSSLSTTPLR